MTDRVLKFGLRVTTDPQLIRLPAFTKVLHFGFQGEAGFSSRENRPYLWALVRDTVHEQDRMFVLAATGQDLPHLPGRMLTHISTSLVSPYETLNESVWHLFELTVRPDIPDAPE